MPILRPKDRWFVEEVLPHEAHFIQLASRLIGDPDNGRDLVHEAFLRLLTSEGWIGIKHPRSYVSTMLRNMAIEQFRRASIVSFQQLTEIDACVIGDEAPDPFRVAAGREEMNKVRVALNSLPESSRDLLIARRIEGRAPSVMSRERGISLSTLEKRLARAYFLLMRALKRDRIAQELPATGTMLDNVSNG
jgi:RNA polymerase sigma-70 factor (ECF subfamily)